jgi:hypothetical protein
VNLQQHLKPIVDMLLNGLISGCTESVNLNVPLSSESVQA